MQKPSNRSGLIVTRSLLLISAAFYALPAVAQYGAKLGGNIASQPSIELNFSVLEKLSKAPASKDFSEQISGEPAPLAPIAAPAVPVRKVPEEQPYVPPVPLPAYAAQPVRTAASAPTPVPATPESATANAAFAPPSVIGVPFARGESFAYKLSDVSSKNFAVSAAIAAKAAKPEKLETVGVPPVRTVQPLPGPEIALQQHTGFAAYAKAGEVEDEKETVVFETRRIDTPAEPAIEPKKSISTEKAPTQKPVKQAVATSKKPVKQATVVEKKIEEKPVKKIDKPVVEKATTFAAAPVAESAPPPKLPIATPAEVVKVIPKPTPQPADHLPPPPSLSDLKFDHLESKRDHLNELADITPDKLLHEDKSKAPALLPEIEVPQDGKSPPPLADLPAMPKTGGKQEDPSALSSLSSKISNVFTKEPEVKHEAASRAVPAPATPALPDIDALTRDGAASAPAPELPKLPKQISEKPKLDAPKVAALPSLPALDALTDPAKNKESVAASEAVLPSLPKPPAIGENPKVTYGEGEAPIEVNEEDIKPPKAVEEEALPAAPPPSLPDIPDKLAEKKSEIDDTPEAPQDIASQQLAALPPALPPGLPASSPAATTIEDLPPPPAPAAVVEKKPTPPASKTVKKAVNSKTPELQVYFTRDTTELSAEAKSDLLELAEKAKSKNLSLRILAYAEGSSEEGSIARRVSLSRALQIRAFLIDKGISQLKINVQAKGNYVTEGLPNRADIFLR